MARPCTICPSSGTCRKVVAYRAAQWNNWNWHCATSAAVDTLDGSAPAANCRTGRCAYSATQLQCCLSGHLADWHCCPRLPLPAASSHLLARLDQHELPHRHLAGQHPAGGPQVGPSIGPQLHQHRCLGHAVIQRSQVALQAVSNESVCVSTAKGQMDEQQEQSRMQQQQRLYFSMKMCLILLPA